MHIKPIYIINKIINKIQVKILQKKFILGNIYPRNLPLDKSGIKRILLYFPDYKIMHLGDHLFFEPLARVLMQNGYEVVIQPASIMQFYFDQLGYISGNIEDGFDLVITRVEFILSLAKHKGAVLYIDITNTNIKQPLCYDIACKILIILGIKNFVFDDKPAMISGNLCVDFGINSNDKYILFNNYIDSGAFRIGSRHQRAIVDFVCNLKEETGYKVIHVGSNKDKERDWHKYDFVDLDLRGKTSVAELFDLVKRENIIYNVSYDAFIMHLFFLVEKRSFILFRGRFLLKYANLMLDYFNPPFFAKNKNALIEYIRLDI